MAGDRGRVRGMLRATAGAALGVGFLVLVFASIVLIWVLPDVWLLVLVGGWVFYLAVVAYFALSRERSSTHRDSRSM